MGLQLGQNFHLILSIFLVSTTAINHRFNCQAGNQLCSIQQQLFNWVVSQGGYISPKLELSMGPYQNYRGLYAIENIEPNEILIEIPTSIQFCAPNLCLLAHKINEEFQKRNDSYWWPYLSTIINDDIDIPALWNAEEINFLHGLQPGNWRSHLIWFQDICHGDIANLDQLKSMLFAITRGRGDENQMCMNPLYEFVAHSYITEINTYFHIANSALSPNPNTPNTWIQTAHKFISSGDLLTNSYGSEDSGRLFRDYGLIVPYGEPHEWYFTDSNGRVLHFGLYPLQTDNNEQQFQLLIADDVNLEEFYDQVHSLLHYVLTNSPKKSDQNKGSIDELPPLSLSQSHHPDHMMISTSSKLTNKRFLIANRYRYNYIKSLRIAAEIVESILEEREEIETKSDGNERNKDEF